jgi:hypothetical protein
MTVTKATDLINLIVEINSSAVHLYVIACLYSFISEKLSCHRNWHSLNLSLIQTQIKQTGQQM